MNTAEQTTRSPEKQEIFKTSTLSASTVVDRVKGRQGTYSVSLKKKYKILWHIQMQLTTTDFYVLLTVHPCIFILVINQLDAQNLSTCAWDGHL